MDLATFRRKRKKSKPSLLGSAARTAGLMAAAGAIPSLLAKQNPIGVLNYVSKSPKAAAVLLASLGVGTYGLHNYRKNKRRPGFTRKGRRYIWRPSGAVLQRNGTIRFQ